MVMQMRLWNAIIEVSLIDPDKVIQVYADGVRHFPIDDSFPFAGYYDNMDAYTDSGAEYISCSKLVQGHLNFTTMKLVFGSETSALDKMKNMTLEFGDIISDNNFASGTNSYSIDEHVYESNQDPSTMNIVWTKTEEVANITEFVYVPMPPVGTNTVFYQTDSYGSQPAQVIGWANSRGMITATYTGDLLVRAYQFGSGTQNHPDGVADAAGAIEQVDWKFSPLDSGDASIGISVSDGKAAPQWDDPPTDSVAHTAIFELNDTVIYNMSYLYDGYQEGPLMGSPVTHIVNANYGCSELNITVNTMTNNPRITAVNIYRKFRTNEKYKLVKQVELDSTWQVQASQGVPDANISSTAFMKSGVSKTIIDDGSAGISYEALTGMPEVLTDTMIDYAESEQLGDFLFVANGSHPHVDNADKYVFRSQPGRYSMFNWSMDYIGLPENIHTLKGAYNRLFAFSEKTMYQIDPYQLSLESTYEGYGIPDKKSVIVTDGMLFLANANGVYNFASGKFKILTTGIQDLYDDIISTYSSVIPLLASDKKYNTLNVIFSKEGTANTDDVPSQGFAYSLDKRRWEKWDFIKDIKSTCITGDNTLLVCGEASNVAGYTLEGFPLDSTGVADYADDPEDYTELKNPYSLWELHEGSAKKNLVWVTKELTMGQDARDKKFKKVKLIGNGVYIKSITVDGTKTDYTEAESLNEDIGNCKYITVNKVGKRIKIEVASTTAATEPTIQNLTVIYNLKTIK